MAVMESAVLGVKIIYTDIPAVLKFPNPIMIEIQLNVLTHIAS